MSPDRVTPKLRHRGTETFNNNRVRVGDLYVSLYDGEGQWVTDVDVFQHGNSAAIRIEGETDGGESFSVVLEDDGGKSPPLRYGQN